MASGSDFLSRGPNHGQESTSYSDTDTVHGSHHIKHSKTTASGTSTFEASQSTFSGDICPPVIPLPLTGKTLVVCFDGTGDQFDLDNSSIVQLFSLLQKDDKTKQMVYYQAGIGTYSGSYKVPQPWLSGIRKAWDLMFAHSIHSHVMSGYEFLMQNYQHGDRICLFGFSRGAFTAWSLAGMIKKVGLLPADNHEQIPFAYKMWTLTDTAGKEQAKEFKKAFSINVNIEFIGVWDTVRSVGIKKVLPDVDSKTIANTVRHAVSLDERRGKFKPDLFLPPAHKKTGIEEVWFAGCHCDVGGGSVSNKTRHSLARIPLRWMIREIFKANAGILFLSDELPSIGMDPRTLYPEVQLRPKPLPSKGLTLRKPPAVEPPIRLYSWLPRFRLYSWMKGQTEDTDSNLAVSSAPLFLGSEEEEELSDALSPVYDQLWLAKSWWVLEWLPVYLYRRVKDQWVGYFKFNRGRPRKIPKQSTKGLKVHRSVRQRMEAEHDDDKLRAKGERYMPRTKWTVMPTWID